jgi:Mce-associated membrane protein
MTRNRGITRIAVLVGVALLLAMTAAGGWFVGSHDDSHEREEAAVIKAARYNVRDLMSYDYRSIDKDMDRALSRTTGSFHDTMSKAMEANRDDFVSLKAVAKVKVIAAAAQSMTDSRAMVLLFVDQTVTNSRTPGPTTDRTRIVMTLSKVAGGWRISKLTLT